MARQILMLVSIASGEWSYQPRQVLTVGDTFTDTTVPADIAAAWLACGHAQRVGAADDATAAETPSAPVERAVGRATRGGRR